MWAWILCLCLSLALTVYSCITPAVAIQAPSVQLVDVKKEDVARTTATVRTRMRKPKPTYDVDAAEVVNTISSESSK